MIFYFLNSSVQNGPNYIKPKDLIATFDNDGIIWSEKPFPVQIHWCLERLSKLQRMILV